jgi:RimJ/RimL family protein N-acetyltransferase
VDYTPHADISTLANIANAATGNETILMSVREMAAAYFNSGRRIFFIASEEAKTPVTPQNYRFVEFSEQDFAQSSLAQMRDRPKVFRFRLSKGHRCYGWRDKDGQIASYLWLSEPTLSDAPWMCELKFMIAPETAYIWDCRTAPGHENRGLYTAGLGQVRRLAAAAGATRVLIDCAPENIPSVRAIEKAGFRHAGDVQLRRIGPLCLVRVNGRKWRPVNRFFDQHWLER